jgi:hypothetical protein
VATNWNSYIVHVDRELAAEERMILGIVETRNGHQSFSSIEQLAELLSLPEPVARPHLAELDVSTVELAISSITCPCCENEAS